MSKSVFISYSWENKDQIENIEDYFKPYDIDIVRDERKLKYKDSIKNFMRENVKKSDYVFLLISDSFLKSKNCMFEVLELLKDNDFKDRVLPFALDAKIYNADAIVDNYLSFWTDKYEELNEKLKKYDRVDTIKLTEDLRIIKNIKESISDFLYEIVDMLHYTFDDFIEVKHKEVLEYIFPNTTFTYENYYEIREQKDISFGGAKRYSLQIKLKDIFTPKRVCSLKEKDVN